MAVTTKVGVLAFAGVAVTIVATSAAYFVRKSWDPENAKQRLRLDPFLYGFEFVLTATLVRYVILRR